VSVKEVSWEEGVTVIARYSYFFYGKEMKIFNLEEDFLHTTDYKQQLRE